MNRIDKTMARLQSEHKKMLSPYITAGDPTPEHTVALMHALVEAGADILEVGIPFSDPMAEGPVIQAAMERALQFGVNCKQVLEMVKTFRQTDKDTPVVVMGYLNPIEYYGYDNFARDASLAGVDGTILVDLPPEESDAIRPIWDAHGLYTIYLCSPTTSAFRMELIKEYAKGYIYYVSLKGVTGSDDLNPDSVQKQYQQRKMQTNLPLMIGFGIKTAEMAAMMAKFADGVIVGAALIGSIIEAFNSGKDCNHAGASLINDMRRAIDNG